MFRTGRPRVEEDVVELLRGEYARDALRELSITLGDFGASRLLDARDQKDLYARARARLAEHPAQPGALRRHGVDLRAPRG